MRTKRGVHGLAAVVVVLGMAASCRPVEEKPAAGRYVPVLPEPRRAAHPQPEVVAWVAAWQGVREQVAALQSELAERQRVHVENHFDGFLELDPETLDHERLCSLFHFLERGYFTIEREILVRLLERRIERAATPMVLPGEGRVTLKERIAAAMQSDELRTVDLETALEYYRRPGDEAFTIPEGLTEDETAELRAAVVEMLEATRRRIRELDVRIAALKEKAGLAVGGAAVETGGVMEEPEKP
jgi:hypothetical protein